MLHWKKGLGFALAGFVLVETALTCWDMVNAQKTIVYDQIYAQSRVQGGHSRYTARVLARKFGRQLSDAFKAEPECGGLNFSVRANRGLRGKPGRWNLQVDMVAEEAPDEVVSIQPWSLIQPNRDGENGSDTQVLTDKGAPATIVKEACEVVKATGA